jgi:hypothetical protein
MLEVDIYSGGLDSKLDLNASSSHQDFSWFFSVPQKMQGYYPYNMTSSFHVVYYPVIRLCVI